jgi:hypothetical protein
MKAAKGYVAAKNRPSEGRDTRLQVMGALPATETKLSKQKQNCKARANPQQHRTVQAVYTWGIEKELRYANRQT